MSSSVQSFFQSLEFVRLDKYYFEPIARALEKKPRSQLFIICTEHSPRYYGRNFLPHIKIVSWCAPTCSPRTTRTQKMKFWGSVFSMHVSSKHISAVSSPSNGATIDSDPMNTNCATLKTLNPSTYDHLMAHYYEHEHTSCAWYGITCLPATWPPKLEGISVCLASMLHIGISQTGSTPTHSMPIWDIF